MQTENEALSCMRHINESISDEGKMMNDVFSVWRGGGGGGNGEMANLTNGKGKFAIAIFRHFSPLFAIFRHW